MKFSGVTGRTAPNAFRDFVGGLSASDPTRITGTELDKSMSLTGKTISVYFSYYSF